MDQLSEKSLQHMRGAIFDVDGTIVDSMKLHLKVWQEIAERYGCSLTIKEVSEKAHGINDEILERIFPGVYSDEEKQKIADEKESLFRELFDPEEHVIKGFIHFIDGLKKRNIPMVIGSAAPKENIDFFTTALGVKDYFKGAIHEDDVVAGKPNPDVFLQAAKEINVPIQDCIVFEDSTSGAEASFRAGSKTIVLLTTKSKSDFKEIPNIMAFVKDYTELAAWDGISS
jgi:HAD superfamily hydrolase (TIGR01509 family)